MTGPIGNRSGIIISVLVLASGMLATLGSWRIVTSHENAELQSATRRTAEGIRIGLLNDLEWQIVGLDRLAMLWEAADPAQPLWTKNADLYIQHRPGCVAVQWLSPDATTGSVVTAGGKPQPLAFDGVPKELMASVIRSRNTMVSRPEGTSGGGRQWIIAYPVYARGEFRGYILSYFDLRKTLDYVFGDVKNLGYSFALALPNKSEYVVPGASHKYENQWGTLLDVPLSGITWQLRVWPNDDVVNEIRSWIPELVLGGGSLLSLLLALSSYLAVRAHLASARTQRVNDALQREVSMREGAQEELRKAHAELAERVEQRTAEVGGANALLRKEIAEHKHTEEKMRDLTGRLFQLQDRERQRLGRELHDGPAQEMVALSIDIGRIRNLIPEHESSGRVLVDDCVRRVKRSWKELRTVSYLLHPPYFEELGLPSGLRDLVDGFAARSGLQISLDLDPSLGRLGNELELGIFRVVQEALSNIHRHAQSRTARITLSRNAKFVHLEVVDEGRGIPPEVLNPDGGGLAGVGIPGMHERIRLLGGKLQIDSSRTGTSIRAVLPVSVANSVQNNTPVWGLDTSV